MWADHYFQIQKVYNKYQQQYQIKKKQTNTQKNNKNTYIYNSINLTIIQNLSFFYIFLTKYIKYYFSIYLKFYFVCHQNVSLGNQIWLSSLALAWKQYQSQSKFCAQAPENAQRAKSLILSYQSLQITPADVDKSCYFRGGVQAFAANKINQELQQRFKGYKIQKISKRIRMDQAIFYGALYKHIKLAHPFYQIPGKIMHFCRNKVPCYQPMQQNQRKQVFVVNYTNQDNFMIRINLIQKGNEMFALMSKNKLSLDQVFELVRKSNDEVQPMTNNDIFKIPQLKIKVSHTITQLSNVRIKLNNEDKKYEISELFQHVQLDMQGQQQKDNIEDLTLIVPQFENPKLKQRRMCLKDPFWIILRKKNCMPYFAMFVNKATDCS